jgi:hypothetical protein
MNVLSSVIKIVAASVSVFLVTVTLADVQPEPPTNDVMLYYTNFEVDVYSGASRESIAAIADCKVALSSSDDVVKAIEYLLKSADHGQFSNALVRMKMVDSEGREVFVEQDGSVYIGGESRTGKLSSSDFNVLKALMDAIALTNHCTGSSLRDELIGYTIDRQ